MSGVCGVMALDERTLRPDEIESMAAVLQRRGPDGTRTWRDERIALGHALLATTEEAMAESLPLTDMETGCTITADVRLDNREELFAALDLHNETRVIGDGELILRAYLQWGEKCPERLLGDFAFAIWDPRARKLFCTRDHMGMRQLYYCHVPGELFLFATEPDSILDHPMAPRRINEGRIADFLDDLEGIDFTSTYFERMFRLPPAHSLTIDDEGLAIRRYWKLQSPPELRLASDAEYADAFLDVFTKAVRCRLRSAGPVGSMLSGGLDSNSVAAVAGQLLTAEGHGPLPVFSAVGPDPLACPETRCIRSALSNRDFAGTTVSLADLGGFQGELALAVENLADPFDAQMTMIRAVYMAAHRQGVRVMLDGVGADLVLTSGNRIAQLVRRLRLRQAVSEARGEARFWNVGQKPWHLLLAATWTALAPKPLRRLRQRFIGWKADRAAMAGKAGLTREFAKRTGLAERRKRYRRHTGGTTAIGKDYQLCIISHPHVAAARERYDRVASTFGIEPRDPFLDLRVVQFCLSLPPGQLRSGGWTKSVLRRAMDGLVLDDIVWRRGKDHLGLQFTEALVTAAGNWRDQWLRVAPALQGISAYPLPKEEADAQVIEIDPKTFIEPFALGCWLSRDGVRRD